MSDHWDTAGRKAEDAARAGQAVRALIDLLASEGLAPDAILAGVHAEVVSTMAVVAGGAVAASACRIAAARVEGLPQAEAFALASAPIVGRA